MQEIQKESKVHCVYGVTGSQKKIQGSLKFNPFSWIRTTIDWLINLLIDCLFCHLTGYIIWKI